MKQQAEVKTAEKGNGHVRYRIDPYVGRRFPHQPWVPDKKVAKDAEKFGQHPNGVDAQSGV